MHLDIEYFANNVGLEGCGKHFNGFVDALS